MTRRIRNSLPSSSVIYPTVINAYFQCINTDPDYVSLQLQLALKTLEFPRFHQTWGITTCGNAQHPEQMTFRIGFGRGKQKYWLLS